MTAWKDKLFFNMDKIYKECDECFGYMEDFSCCDAEAYNNRCSECGKFSKTHPCYSCDGSGGEYLEIGSFGTMITDVVNCQKKFDKKQISLIKKKGHRTKDMYHPTLYHNDVKIVDIVDERNIIVVLGEYGRKRFIISIDEFYR